MTNYEIEYSKQGGIKMIHQKEIKNCDNCGHALHYINDIRCSYMGHPGIIVVDDDKWNMDIIPCDHWIEIDDGEDE